MVILKEKGTLKGLTTSMVLKDSDILPDTGYTITVVFQASISLST